MEPRSGRGIAATCWRVRGTAPTAELSANRRMGQVDLGGACARFLRTGKFLLVTAALCIYLFFSRKMIDQLMNQHPPRTEVIVHFTSYWKANIISFEGRVMLGLQSASSPLAGRRPLTVGPDYRVKSLTDRGGSSVATAPVRRRRR